MIGSMLLLAAALAAAEPDVAVTELTCNLALTNGSQFGLNGRFSSSGLQSNLSTLIKDDGVFAPPAQGVVITTDGTDNYIWSLNSDSRKYDVYLTSYGGGVALLRLEERRFVGRHFVRDLVGVGFCNLRRRQAGGKTS